MALTASRIASVPCRGPDRTRVAPLGACAYTVRLPCPVFAPLLKSDP
jgi:hypothetical protein